MSTKRLGVWLDGSRGATVEAKKPRTCDAATNVMSWSTATQTDGAPDYFLKETTYS